MKFFKKNLISRGFVIIALFVLFFIMPADRAGAVDATTLNDYSYWSEDSATKDCLCHSLQALSPTDAASRIEGLNPIPNKCGSAVAGVSLGTPDVVEGSCLAETQSTQLITYHCIVINDPSGQFNPGKCLDFTSTNLSDANITARQKCAMSSNEENTLLAQDGACSAVGVSGCGGKLKGSIEELQCQASSLNKANLSTPAQLVGRFINILLAFIGSISLVLYIYAGILWMTASGTTERVDKAKKILVWTTLGVVVMLSSYMLASFVFKSLGL